MRVIVFRHVPDEGIGLLQDALQACGITIEYATLFRESARVPDISRAGGLIFMGGPMSVNDPLPFIEQELQLIQQAVERSQPVLGICLGAQLIAKALGARVSKNLEREIGWFDVSPTADGRNDPLLRHLHNPEPLFQWHGETFDLPHGAVWLARSERCRNQAFRVGSSVYGFQFHLEATPEIITRWCDQDAQCGNLREMEGSVDPQAHAGRLAQLSRQVFTGWSALLQ